MRRQDIVSQDKSNAADEPMEIDEELVKMAGLGRKIPSCRNLSRTVRVFTCFRDGVNATFPWGYFNHIAVYLSTV
jgi:hypothetical protein